jgi:hypothetical protein
MSATYSHKTALVRMLLAGAYISLVHGKLTLYEGSQRPVLRISRGLFKYVSPVLKKHKKRERFLISLRAVQQLHGKHLIKKAYKQLRNEKTDHRDGPGNRENRCSPCVVEHLFESPAGRGPADHENQLTFF